MSVDIERPEPQVAERAVRGGDFAGRDGIGDSWWGTIRSLGRPIGLRVWSCSHSSVANSNLRARRAVSAASLMARRVRASIWVLAVIALPGSIARHSNRTVRSGSVAGSVGAAVADVDPQLIGWRQILQRALRERLRGASGRASGRPPVSVSA